MRQRATELTTMCWLVLVAALAISLLRPERAPAASPMPTPAIVIVVATPTISLPVDIPAPTAVPLAVEPPTPVPPLAVESVVQSAPHVQVVAPAPAPPTPDLRPRMVAEPTPAMGGKPNRREAPPRYEVDPIHGAPEAVTP